MNDEMSPREHADVRDLVMAGAQRIKPIGSRRRQVVAASAALVLVAGVSGGAIAMATQFRSADIPPVTLPSPAVTPTQTPSPSPMASLDPDAEARPAVQAFDGSCANVVDLEWLSEKYGTQMIEFPMPWQNPGTALAGGIDCLWSTRGAYMSPALNVNAYPVENIDLAAASLSPTCDGDFCEATAVAGEVWISVSAAHVGIDVEWIRAVVETIALRATEFPDPEGAERTPKWWSMPTCAAVEGTFPTDWLNRIRSNPPADGSTHLGARFAGMASAEARFRATCGWEATTSSTDGTWGLMSITVVPGGAPFFDQIAQVDGAAPIDVPGADRAVSVRDNYQWEGYAPAVAMLSGANVLIIRGDNGLPPEHLVPLAPFILTMLNAAP